MPVPAFRVAQPTSTTGTGTVTTSAADAPYRSWATAFGAVSQAVRRIIQRDSVWEIGYGNFNGTDQHTRSTVVASSNSGSLVSLGAGVADVFFDFMPGDRVLYNVTGSATLTLADLGNLVRCTPSADMTLTLPAVATVPGRDGAVSMGYLIRNDGTNNAVVWIDPNASENLEGSTSPYPLFRGESIEIFSTGTLWRAGHQPTGWRLVAQASASSSASVDFVLPNYPGAANSSYRIEFRQVRPSTDGAYLLLRTDDAGGASFDAGGTDYVSSDVYPDTAATATGTSTAGSGIQLSTDLDSTVAANNCTGELLFNPGASGARYPTVVGTSAASGNGATYAGHQILLFSGIRDSAYDANAIRLIMSTGNISLGTFSLYASYG